jgi:DNA-binding MarR family transcriptional regulator
VTARAADQDAQAGDHKEAMITEISVALAHLQAAYDDRDRALAQYLGIGRTDMRCLDLVIRGGPQTASELGVRLHLTRGSMTTLIDRLERAGYVRRSDDPSHGRRKLIIAQPGLADAMTPILERKAQGARELRSLPAADLRVILRFLHTTLAGQDTVLQAILALAPARNPLTTSGDAS